MKEINDWSSWKIQFLINHDEFGGESIIYELMDLFEQV